MSIFRKAIESVINRGCKENDSNTPDFILADYLCNCLDAFTLATNTRDEWYGVHRELKEDAPRRFEMGTAQAATTCSACGCELTCRNHCHDTNSPHGITAI